MPIEGQEGSDKKKYVKKLKEEVEEENTTDNDELDLSID